MLDEITTIRRRFARHGTLDGCIDEAFVAMRGLGYEALIYDYTPVPYDLDGSIMIPSMLKLRNIDDDMYDYWCDRGYFRIDPVQLVAAHSSVPFAWNYDDAADTEIRALLNETTEPVARYLRERDLTRGVTIPIHMPRGGYATVTGVRLGAGEDLPCDPGSIAQFGLLAHVFHDAAYAYYNRSTLSPRLPALTERERECLRHSAHGLSAKEIARVIGRSVPTVVMHLTAAARKLGARNRTQAVVRAAHFRLLDN
ncbi:MAG: LuxR family transcriptional regulator [Mesorhizobium sp.]|uniref:helix-turn-helix transcriptional regulator n=1 Tax=Mesorhizobium sp. TaxID=1871066 RepID=UPI0011F872CF|nr:LuxR family transcriptional regulator [Mesorhizobium sp.]TIP72956.1 MAG: LuxR family transcriptional regulator [Mesorhizobium sp.]TIQ13702.1 MAG: LuxR family transcriptional regulator [Mesorhizobium sp.]TIR51784.1 MAG: LuxR family transcriptional regulator [Mesorhizobium sp.]TJV96937.1 MAG: LuxR family transcriptional regulator [Mesorhizobium sp.]